jgi:hypothetical protein
MAFWKENDVIYTDPRWMDHRYFNIYYIVKNGCIRQVSKLTGSAYKDPSIDEKGKIIEWFKTLGYEYKGFDDRFVCRTILNPFVNKPIEEAEENIKRLAERLHKRHEKRERLLTQFEKMDDQFQEYVVGLANDIDIYSSGFSVRVLLASYHSFDERRLFVKSHKKDLAKWTIWRIAENSRMMKKIGSLDFYKPVEIITLRSPEVEIKFQIKNTDVFDEKEGV